MSSPDQQNKSPARAITPVILAGGGGTRLWPLSTRANPKQFHQLAGPGSLLQQTIQRFAGPGHDRPDSHKYAPLLVMTSTRHSARVISQAHRVGCTDLTVMEEPAPRNTAAAIAAAAVWLARQAARSDEDPMLLVLPTDHHIKDPGALHSHVAQALTLARDGALVTFGIKPTSAETGYGYIQRGAVLGAGFASAGFYEKPDLKTAQRYLAQGDFYWNSGIFLFSGSAILKALRAHAPEIVKAAEAAVEGGRGDDAASFTLEPGAFARSPALPIDIAVLERAGNVAVIPAAMGWNDIGSWQSVAGAGACNAQGNFTQGSVISIDSQRCYLRTDAGLLATVGVSDLVVVRSGEVVLVCPRDNTRATAQGQAAIASLRASDVAPGPPLALQPQAERIRAWMVKAALPLWINAGWDGAFGGFHEFLTPQGHPPAGANKRLRVQARQIFVYSKAGAMGWVSDQTQTGQSRVDMALATLVKRGWQATGGWLHLFTDDGRASDTRRDTYDHAFVLLGLAWVYRTTGNPRALTWARRTLAYLDAVLADPECGGYFEAIPAESPRRANPHMHLLEALLALFDATGDYSYLDRATAIVDLFNAHFFDSDTGSVGEYFEADWQPAQGRAGTLREPGHHYEWASLLAIYAYKSGRDCTGAIERLFGFSERHGLARQTGLAFDQTLKDGTVSDTHHRLWPQTEALRAAVLMARNHHPGALERARTLIDVIFKYFLDPMPAGLWLDRIDAAGRPACDTVPASTLYHLVVAFSAVVEATGHSDPAG